MAFRRSWLAPMLVLVAAAMVFVGCGGSGSSGDSGGSTTASALSSEHPVTVKVGVLPIGAVAPIYLGVKKGFFRAEGLDVKPQIAQGGAAIVPAVVSGDYQFGYASVATLFFSHDKGLPLKVVAPAGLVGKTDETGIYVGAKSPIKTLADLRGKTLALNTLNQVDQVVITALLDKAGVEPKSVKLIEVPFPNMPAALAAGRVDAVAATEPFVSAIKGAGGHIVVRTYRSIAPRLAVASYFTTDDYIQKHKDVVAAFQRGMDRSLEYAGAHIDEIRKVIPTYTQIPAAVAAKLGSMPEFTTDPNAGTIELQGRLMKEQGLIKDVAPLDELIYRSGGN